MTIEQWLRGHFQEIGQDIDQDVLLSAAISPAEASPVSLRVVGLSDEYEDYIGDEEYLKSARYALSTVYYAMSGAISGGTRSEKRGNRQITKGGKPIDVATREAWRKLGDYYRGLTGSAVDESAQLNSDGGMFDASSLRSKTGWR